MNCSRCGKAISEDQAYVHQGKAFCDDCLMDIGLSGHQCDPWATYVDKSAQLRKGLKGAEGLSPSEKEVYEFVKSKGKATREDVMKELGLSDTDLKVQLVPLMHSDLIKEQSDKGTMYLIVPSGK